ncbi:MAG TPA: hypothetical protein VH278_12135 [Burkholderiaceae bacterium]|jgi:hypothetical protein|nr:hypothetical protein [Burkholderiaceae bacterium]
MDNAMIETVEPETPPAQRALRPRKLNIDREIYCPHSVRASGGDISCDHDFDPTPSIRHETFAVWNCTHCGREFRYEVWSVGSGVRP